MQNVATGRHLRCRNRGGVLEPSLQKTIFHDFPHFEIVRFMLGAAQIVYTTTKSPEKRNITSRSELFYILLNVCEHLGVDHNFG